MMPNDHKAKGFFAAGGHGTRHGFDATSWHAMGKGLMVTQY